jgi:hypothetical protein
MDDNLLPKELVQKCFALVESSHQRLGFGTLPKVIAIGENMVPLALVPDALTLMGSVGATHKIRILSWVAGLAVVVGGLTLSHWIFLGLVVVLIAVRKLASEERRQWMLLAAFKLALEMLATNFAGWGDAYSQERKKALELLGDKPRTTLLDVYLPRRNELDAPLLQAFGPGGV